MICIYSCRRKWPTCFQKPYSFQISWIAIPSNQLKLSYLISFRILLHFMNPLYMFYMITWSFISPCILIYSNALMKIYSNTLMNEWQHSIGYHKKFATISPTITYCWKPDMIANVVYFGYSNRSLTNENVNKRIRMGIGFLSFGTVNCRFLVTNCILQLHLCVSMEKKFVTTKPPIYPQRQVLSTIIP